MAMTASISGSAASMDVSQTQNTAPVLEFRCLYTQDLRRKQKRWQDGRLKFHTFNKRVMVYDDRSNFVGDTHWREDSEFAEGEELELERSGTLVEVGECVGKRDQDLTELVDKRVKEREERAAAKVTSPAVSLFRSQGTPTPNVLRSKALNTLVTPNGHYGRALLPATSPFEERQGLAGGQEKDEQERPAKRRKPNEPTSSRNGYAQNLMGATLNLTSSRPPSTGPIRYEPVRLTTSTPARSEAIDLTLDGSDDSDQGVNLRTNEVTVATKPSKQQKKPRRSPPAKSGYASNLTGAALTLSRPDSFVQIRPSKLSASRPIVPNNQESPDASSHDDDSFAEIVSPKRPTAKKATKPKEVSRSHKPGTSPLLSSSSTPVRNNKTPMPNKEVRRPRPVTQNSSAVEPRPDKPTSPLRIKARSGPKMMMLMNRPSSRANASADSSGQRRTKSTPIQHLSKPSNEVVLSQATMELNAFCQKQEERLQARLRGERRPMVMDLDDEDDLSASPVESGIGHQTTDQLLSRRSKLAAKQAKASSKSDIDYNERSEKQASKGSLQLTHEEQHSQEQSTSTSDTLSPPTRPGSMLAELLLQAPQSRSVISANPVPEVVGIAMAQSPSATSNVDDHLVHSNPLEAVLAISQPIQIGIDRPGPEQPEQSSRKPRPLAQHVIGDIQAATEHFRALIKSSASQQHELTGVPPRPPEVEVEQMVAIIRPLPENQETTSRELPLKTFSELLQPPGNSAVSEPELHDNAIEAAPRATISPVPPLVQTNPPPRRILVNPATRGKSVQILAANTIDTLNNATPNIMAPPPPRLSSRTETINGRSDVVTAGADRVAAKEVSDGGPWSREAFDLFDTRTCERIMAQRARVRE